MRKKIRVIILLLFIVLVGIQFVPVNRTNPPVTAEINAPRPVQEILERACYDCHSNESVWPWYSHIAPLSWRINGHVKHGRKEMNFSEWDKYDGNDQRKLKEHIYEEVSEGEMPLKDYLLMHKNAKLSDEDVDILGDWSVANPL